MVKAILFDLYDTLAYLEPSEYLAAKNKMSKLAGVERDSFVSSWRRFSSESASGKMNTAERATATLRELNIEPNSELIEGIVRIEERLQEQAPQLFKSTRPVLSNLKASGYKLGLVSNTSVAARRLPEMLSISSYLDSVILSFMVGLVKPDPRIFLVAANSLNVQPHDCLYVGDGNDRELDGAHSVGMLTVLIEQEKNIVLRTKQSAHFDFKIIDLVELLDILKKCEVEGSE